MVAHNRRTRCTVSVLYSSTKSKQYTPLKVKVSRVNVPSVSLFTLLSNTIGSMYNSSGSRRSTLLTSLGWVLWVFSALAVVLQMWQSKIHPQSADMQLVIRYLEQGADEDDQLFEIDTSIGIEKDDDSEWFTLEHWVQPSTLLYDVIEGFLYVGDAFFIAWILWGCLVHCGVFPDDRLDRNRRERRVKDGRGVFAPLRDFDALNSDDEDDDKSRDSMEYGDAHDDDEYGEVNIEEEEKKIAQAAEEFFQKAEKHKKQNEKGNAPGPEETLLLDLEMPEQQRERQGSQGPVNVVFL